MDHDTSTSQAGSDRPDTAAGHARRRLLAAGFGGAALSLLPLLSRRASATTPPSSTTGPTSSSGSTPSTTSTPAPTTTAPRKRPTEADVTLLDFAQSVELSARELYDRALALPGWPPDQAVVVGTIREDHSAYANSLSGLLGRLSTNRPDQAVIDTFSADFSSNPTGVLDAAYTLESELVATHLDILGELQGTDAADLLGSVVNIEARHSTVVASLAGTSDLDVLLVTQEAAALRLAGG